MRNPILLCLLMGIFVLGGCTTETTNRVRNFKTGTGDPGQFILREVIANGHRPANPKEVPAITGPWSYARDEQGVVVLMPRDCYRQVEAFLRTAFGQPRFGPMETTDGGRLGGYRFEPHSGALHFGHDTQKTQVVILKRQLAE